MPSCRRVPSMSHSMVGFGMLLLVKQLDGICMEHFDDSVTSDSSSSRAMSECQEPGSPDFGLDPYLIGAENDSIGHPYPVEQAVDPSWDCTPALEVAGGD